MRRSPKRISIGLALMGSQLSRYRSALQSLLPPKTSPAESECRFLSEEVLYKFQRCPLKPGSRVTRSQQRRSHSADNATRPRASTPHQSAQCKMMSQSRSRCQRYQESGRGGPTACLIPPFRKADSPLQSRHETSPGPKNDDFRDESYLVSVGWLHKDQPGLQELLNDCGPDPVRK